MTYISILDTGCATSQKFHEQVFGEGISLCCGRNLVEEGERPIDINGHGSGIISIVAATARRTAPDILLNLLVHKVESNGTRMNQVNWAEAIEATLEWRAATGERGCLLLAAGALGLSPDLARAVEAANRHEMPDRKSVV